MNPEIVNMYIERLLQEIQELTKNRLLIETQLRYTERMNVDFQTKLKEAEVQIEKLNKKKSKEVNTSNEF
jgi:phage shock protein A